MSLTAGTRLGPYEIRGALGKGGMGEVYHIAIPIAEGLAAAHSQGIIHRDLKPENIFLTSEDRVKILDFGLARLSPHVPTGQITQAETASRLTNTNPVVGTVPYMSPEQVRGAAVDARTDIFAFGCVLYEMLTGQRAFADASTADTVAAILTQAPSTPSQLGKQNPPALEGVLLHCLEKDPDQRFQTARDLAFDLKAISTAGLTIHAPAGIVRSRRTRWGIAATLFVVLLSAIFLTARFYSGQSIDSLAVMPFTNTPADADTDYLSDGISERIISSLSQLPQLRVMARSTVFTYKGKQVEPQKIGNDLHVGAVLTGAMIRRGDNLTIRAELVRTTDGSQIWGAEYNRPLADLFLVQEEIAKEISENLRLKLTAVQEKELTKRYTENREAYDLYLKGRYYWNKRTFEGFTKAKEYFQQALDKDPSYALAYVGLADYYVQPGYNRLPPEETLPKAIAAAKKAIEIDSTLAEPHAVLALAEWQYKKDPVVAEKDFKKAIELNPNYPTGHQWYSLFLSETGRSQEAMAEIRRAINLDPLALPIQTSCGDILRDSRQYDQAVQQYRKVIEMDPSFAQVYFNLGILYDYRGMHDDAVKEYLAGMRLGKHPELAEWTELYNASGWRSIWQSELDFQMNQVKQKQPVDPWAVARIYFIMGDSDKAYEWTERYYNENKNDVTVRYDLQFSPMFDPIRSDPRFVVLLKRVTAPSS